MILLPGSQAYSKFRINKLLSLVQKDAPSVHEISSQYCHFVKLKSLDGNDVKLSDDELNQLNELLEYGEIFNYSSNQILNQADATQSYGESECNRVYIVPRLGTISPWSSKATDIIHNCGLPQIERIERGIRFDIHSGSSLTQQEIAAIAAHFFDPMTESLVHQEQQLDDLFQQELPKPLFEIPLLTQGKTALEQANNTLGLALSSVELDYLLEQYQHLSKNPTDVELMMFAQVNSEHCRHKIFNANWIIDNYNKEHSLFNMIRETHRQNPTGTLVAYSDNSSVLEGSRGDRFYSDPKTKQYIKNKEDIHILCKVETHNHPTAISPFAGAATGSGGEIRDEGATGRGSKPKAGLCGFSVSHLRIPNAVQPWEGEQQKPKRIASPLQIMLEGPIGAASFNNEFGRPNITGYFRTYEQEIKDLEGEVDVRGYHKPIMLAGGLGNIRSNHVEKNTIPAGAKIIVLGGPAMLIGLGGGAASSVSSGTRTESLDFASVQRGNAEMQRRCQEVIDFCCAMGEDNPIISIHDVGAGGLCNALPELVGDAQRGGRFELRDILNDEKSMTPMQIWCNEAQERYVLAISPDRLSDFEKICEREKSLYCVVGEATQKQQLILDDQHFADQKGSQARPIDLPMDTLFANPPKMLKEVETHSLKLADLDFSDIEFFPALQRVLSCPTVADKTFLISIGDRSVTGLVARDQMVGPWQVPVSDVAVTLSDHFNHTGEAMAMGERTPLAAVDAPASGRMAIAEALTNLMAVNVRSLNEVKLSANWMAASGHKADDAALYNTVKAVGMELCPALGIAIPVGKDSMSMKTVWQSQGEEKQVTAPVSCVISAFSPVVDVDKTVTAYMQTNDDKGDIYFLDLSKGQARMANSILAQVYNQVGQLCPDVDDANHLKNGLLLIKELVDNTLVSAYHDRSDGGLITTLLEMSFASRCGLEIDLSDMPGETALEKCFNEELGVCVQIRDADLAQAQALLDSYGFANHYYRIAKVTAGELIQVYDQQTLILKESRVDLHRLWSKTSYEMQLLRDNPVCAQQEYDRILDTQDTGLFSKLSFDVHNDICQHYNSMATQSQPKVAILREQGVNSHIEMAAAFSQAGFNAVDVTMTDLQSRRVDLSEFKGLVACGGFSYGDVLGAGQGWAKSILFSAYLSTQFSQFFKREDTFTLGICNGCQMLSGLKQLIPGAQHWPQFVRNTSEQYEARLVQIQVPDTNSLFFAGMQGSQFPIVVAHGEGRAQFSSDAKLDASKQHIALQYIDYKGDLATQYPANPNGSPMGIAGMTSLDGRATILMPHPERIYRTSSHSWHPKEWGEYSPWMRIFRNARKWVG